MRVHQFTRRDPEVVESDGKRFGRVDYFGAHTVASASNDGRGPQGYLVIQPSQTTVRVHYHEVPQFQVFLKGTARIGRLSVTPITVLYTDAGTAYGPIVPVDGDLEYLTLRPRHDRGARYLPEEAAARPTPASRRRVGSYDVHFTNSAVKNPIELWEAGADEPAACMVHLGATQELPLDRWAASAPQFLLVVSGQLHAGSDLVLGDGSCIHLEAEEVARFPVIAGDNGATVLLLRFPSTDNETP